MRERAREGGREGKLKREFVAVYIHTLQPGSPVSKAKGKLCTERVVGLCEA